MTRLTHLNNVFGAHLRITSLRASVGPGIELLEYLAPSDGSPFPADEHANDIVHRQTAVVTNHAEAGPNNFQMCERSLYLPAWYQNRMDS